MLGALNVLPMTSVSNMDWRGPSETGWLELPQAEPVAQRYVSIEATVVVNERFISQRSVWKKVPLTPEADAAVGTVNVALPAAAPESVSLPTLPAFDSVNQMFPSGPTQIAAGCAFGVGTSNSVITP